MPGVTRARLKSRTVYAAILLGAALAVLLVAWFASAWGETRRRQQGLLEGLETAARQQAGELARDIRNEIGTLMRRESERPYFHYQNLFHDPLASIGLNVSPSPLARGPEDPLVLGYFQIDAKGHTTTPTINDDLPELSEPKRLAENRRFRDQVVRNLSAALAPTKAGPLVAEAAVKPKSKRVLVTIPVPSAPPPQAAPVQQAPPPQSPLQQQQAAGVQQAQVPAPPQQQAPQQQALQQQAQVVQLDDNTYTQNNFSNSVWVQQQQMDGNGNASGSSLRSLRTNPVQQQRSKPRANPPANVKSRSVSSVEEDTTPAQPIQPPIQVPLRNPEPPPVQRQEPPAAPRPDASPPATRQVWREVAEPTPAPPPKPITITVSPLEWRTMTFAGQPALVAVRRVETPDGNLTQGFVIDRTSLTSWLAAHAGHAVAELHTQDQADELDGAPIGAPTGVEVAAGWYVAIQPNPQDLADASNEAAHLARSFLLRFALLAVIALLAGALVVRLVAKAERLARERSQFAAAAAHELRTPLAGLQLYGDMLADGLGDPNKLRDYARRMSEEASRLGRVVSNVLGFSQLERGNLSVEPRVGALGEALCDLASRAQPALDRAGVVLDLDVAPELSAKFDRDALARIVGNLLDNAEKYSREAADRTIALAAHEVGDSVEVTVADHGPGITQQTRARLFRPFARGVTSDGPAGLGLGLALSQSLARAMGGSLDYREPAGGGAMFVLRLARA